MYGLKGWGVYTSCSGTTEYFDRLEAKFFYAHPNLKWVGTDTTNAPNVPGVIKIGPKNLITARVDLTAPNGTWYQTSGKVYANLVYYYKPGTNGESSYNGPVDVLACVR